MIAFGHTAVGAGVGLLTFEITQHAKTPEGLLLALGLGIVSHYLADLVPHGHFFRDDKFHKKIIWVILFDFLLSILIFAFAAYSRAGIDIRFLYILFGIFGSQMPDMLDGLIYSDIIPSKGLINFENKFHQSTHWHGKGKHALLLGERDIWQLIVVVIALVAVLKY